MQRSISPSRQLCATFCERIATRYENGEWICLLASHLKPIAGHFVCWTSWSCGLFVSLSCWKLHYPLTLIRDGNSNKVCYQGSGPVAYVETMCTSLLAVAVVVTVSASQNLDKVNRLFSFGATVQHYAGSWHFRCLVCSPHNP